MNIGTEYLSYSSLHLVINKYLLDELIEHMRPREIKQFIQDHTATI